jgi:hypothetical protein
MLRHFPDEFTRAGAYNGRSVGLTYEFVWKLAALFCVPPLVQADPQKFPGRHSIVGGLELCN